MMRAWILAAACAAMAGCATSHGVGTDEAYMAKVEKGADIAGAKVVWVNPPAATDDEQNAKPAAAAAPKTN